MEVILPLCYEVNGFVTASLAGWNDVVSTAGAAKQCGCSSDEQPRFRNLTMKLRTKLMQQRGQHG